MGSRTIYTSTIRVPIYVGWKCSKCGEKNFAQGVIVCQRQTSSASLFSSSHEEAKNRASEAVQNEWKDDALNIMLHFKDHRKEALRFLFVQESNCTKCHSKQDWDRKEKAWSFLAWPVAIISGLLAFSMKNNIGAWLVFGISTAIIAYSLWEKTRFNNYFDALTDAETPIIGSLNQELVDYARESRGVVLPTPTEVMERLQIKEDQRYNIESDTTQNETPTGDIVKKQEQDMGKESNCFCRMCGARLPKDSKFCNKCGERLQE